MVVFNLVRLVQQEIDYLGLLRSSLIHLFGCVDTFTVCHVCAAAVCAARVSLTAIWGETVGLIDKGLEIRDLEDLAALLVVSDQCVHLSSLGLVVLSEESLHLLIVEELVLI